MQSHSYPYPNSVFGKASTCRDGSAYILPIHVFPLKQKQTILFKLSRYSFQLIHLYSEPRCYYFEMDSFFHLASDSQTVDQAFVHMGAWRDEIPSSAYSASLEICKNSTKNSPAFGKRGNNDENPIAAPSKYKIPKMPTPKSANITSHALIRSKQTDIDIFEPEVTESPYVKTWLMESAREGPWKVIETAPTAFASGPFPTHFQGAISETGAVDGDALSDADMTDAGQGFGNSGSREHISASRMFGQQTDGFHNHASHEGSSHRIL